MFGTNRGDVVLPVAIVPQGGDAPVSAPLPSGKIGVATAQAETPDLILMDINMPEVDGWEATRQIKADDKTVTIGAMSTHHQIESSPDVQRLVPGLAKMASLIGDTQVRHRGTMGGSLANNDPSACYFFFFVSLCS